MSLSVDPGCARPPLPPACCSACADGGGHFLLAARIHHHIGDAAHQVFAEADLRVHQAGGGHHLARREIGEMGGNGGGAHVDGDADRALSWKPGQIATSRLPPPGAREIDGGR